MVVKIESFLLTVIVVKEFNFNSSVKCDKIRTAEEELYERDRYKYEDEDDDEESMRARGRRGRMSRMRAMSDYDRDYDDDFEDRRHMREEEERFYNKPYEFGRGRSTRYVRF